MNVVSYLISESNVMTKIALEPSFSMQGENINKFNR